MKTSRMALILCCSVALVGGASEVAFAQGGAPNPAGHWTVTPSILLGTGGNLDSTGAGVGLSAGYAWDPHLAWEAAFTSLPSVDQGALLTVNSNLWTATGNLLYFFTGEHAYSPYVAGGIGFGHGSADIPTNLQGLGLNDSSTNFLVDLGGGLSRQLSDRLNVRGDLRYFIGGDLVPDFWRASIGIGIDVGRQ